MPTYRFRCPTHGDHDEWRSIHDATVVLCDICAAPLQRVMTPPRISVYATPHKGAEAKRIDAGDARLNEDLPAYKALRRQGYQPPSVDGSAILQRDATDQLDITMGKKAFVDKHSYEKAREVQQALAESAREGSFASEYGKTLPRKVS